MNLQTYAPPVVLLVYLALYATFAWRDASTHKAAKSSELGKSIDYHNSQIYRDFEFFVQIFLAIVAALGFVRMQNSPTTEIRRIMSGLGFVGLLSAASLATFVIIHQASKIRRWQETIWRDLWRWQEVIMLVTMWFAASFAWWAARTW